MVLNSREEIGDRRCGMFFFEKLVCIWIKVVHPHYKQYLLSTPFYLLSKNKEQPCFT